MSARVSAVAVLVLLALVAWRSAFTVSQDQSALCTRFGQIESSEYGPGLHLTSPLDQVHRFDRRILSRTFAGESFLTSDQQPLSVDFLLRWRLADAPLFYQATGGDEDMVAQRLADLARDRLKSTVAHESLAMISGTARGGLSATDFQQLQGAARQFGIDLVDLQLQRIDLTDEAANAVYQHMEQGFTAQAQQQDATGTLQADRTRDDADRKRATMLADATRQAQQIRGAADARAAAIYAQAYGSNPEFAAFTESLQAYKSTIGRDGDILVITPEGEFFKYLQSATGH